MNEVPMQLNKEEANLVRRLINVHIAQLQEEQEALDPLNGVKIGDYWQQVKNNGNLADHSTSLALYNRFHQLCNVWDE